MNSGLSEATAFLTVVGRGRTPSASALRWFPVVGAALGGVLGVIWLFAHHAWPPAVAAAIVVASDLGLTGLLHIDGLIDSADGLLPHLGAARRLEVMAEPGVGAFGIATAVIALVLRTAALATLVPDVRLLAALWCLSRTGMAVASLTVPYARAEGLASAFIEQPESQRSSTGVALGLGLVAALILGLWWRVIPGLVCVLSGLVAGAAVIALARRRVGGFTGDVLGAAGVLAETIGLVVAAARW